MPVIVNLQKIEDIAVQDQFYFIIGVFSGRVIMQKFTELLVKIKFLEIIQLSGVEGAPHPEMQIAHH
jgi:hypothetical protein